MSQDPQIFDIDPEGAPRMTAIILLACGLLGVCFLLVNVVFTGQDQYYVEEEWQEGNEPVNQRYDIMPNLVRGKHVDADSEEDEEAQDVPVKKPAAKKKPTTGPVYPFPVRPSTPATGPAGSSR